VTSLSKFCGVDGVLLATTAGLSSSEDACSTSPKVAAVVHAARSTWIKIGRHDLGDTPSCLRVNQVGFGEP
jgi:hypothetical protein